MVQPQLSAAVAAESHLAAFVADLRDGTGTPQLTAPPALHPFVAAALSDGPGVTVAVTATEREADELARAIGALIGPAAVAT
ncbi:hypothetical protein, partial [Aeromicrobium sp.]|uniref:hypothetical protein n=1 Tax=Aeromicrobium sp. TaxID=1871063 RepID=UPI0028A843C3